MKLKVLTTTCPGLSGEVHREKTFCKLSEDMKSKNSGINWEKIYGLRNILAHHYFGINVDLIWQIIQNDIPILKNELIKLINIKK